MLAAGTHIESALDTLVGLNLVLFVHARAVDGRDGEVLV